MNNISAVIVANGNPPHIFESLDSISDFVNEVIVVDIGLDSEVVNKLNKTKLVTVKKIHEKISYVELIREKSKGFAKNEYVLFLDPDELLSPKLVSLLQQEYINYDFFSIPRKNIIMSKWIEHSRWWPDYQIRLFKKSHVKWPVKLHAQPEVTGNGYTVEEKDELSIIHHNYENLTEYFSKMIRYANTEADEIMQRKEIYNLQTAVKKALQEFISRYFGDKGYKDGMHGFVLSFLQMMNAFVVYFYYWEKRKYEEVTTKQINEAILTFYSQGLYEVSFWMEKEKISQISLKQKVISKFLSR